MCLRFKPFGVLTSRVDIAWRLSRKLPLPLCLLDVTMITGVAMTTLAFVPLGDKAMFLEV